MKFAVSYIMITRATRRRAGRSRTEVVNIEDDSNYVGALSYDEAFQPRAVEHIFQDLHHDQHFECKVIDVREVFDTVTEQEKADLIRIANRIGLTIPHDDANLWRYHVSVRMMEKTSPLSEPLRRKWRGIPATKRQEILSEVQ